MLFNVDPQTTTSATPLNIMIDGATPTQDTAHSSLSEIREALERGPSRHIISQRFNEIEVLMDEVWKSSEDIDIQNCVILAKAFGNLMDSVSFERHTFIFRFYRAVVPESARPHVAKVWWLDSFGDRSKLKEFEYFAKELMLGIGMDVQMEVEEKCKKYNQVKCPCLSVHSHVRIS